jgi:hypothetical protein
MNQILESLKVKGNVSIVLDKADGTQENIDIKNLVVSTGLNFIVSRMKDTSQSAMTHMELGTGTTAAANADTALQAAIAGSRQGLGSTTVSGNQITYVASFAAGVGTGAVTEAGLFNAGAAGTMACRTVFPVVNKQAGDSMTVTWTVTVS